MTRRGTFCRISIAVVFCVVSIHSGRSGNGDCPLGYCSLPTTSSQNETCDVEVDDVCDPDVYCHSNGQCYKDRGSPNVFCNCTEGRYGNSCQFVYEYNNTVLFNASDCTNWTYSDSIASVCDNRVLCWNASFYGNHCICLPGYRGRHCEIATRITHNPIDNTGCYNGGTLYAQAGLVKCMCPCGFTDTLCRTRIISEHSYTTDIICRNGEADRVGSCNDISKPTDFVSGGCQNGEEDNLGRCKCRCGYFGSYCEFSTNTSHPNYRDICAVSSPCYNGGVCYMSDNMCEPSCNCPYLYTGQNCRTYIVTDSPFNNENKDTSNTNTTKGTKANIGIMLVGPVVAIGVCFVCFMIYCFKFREKRNRTDCTDNNEITANRSQSGSNNITMQTDRFRFRGDPGRIRVLSTGRDNRDLMRQTGNRVTLSSHAVPVVNTAYSRNSISHPTRTPKPSPRQTFRPISTTSSTVSISETRGHLSTLSRGRLRRNGSRISSTFSTPRNSVRSPPPSYSRLSISEISGHLYSMPTSTSGRRTPSTLPPPYSSAPPSQHGDRLSTMSGSDPPNYEDVCEGLPTYSDAIRYI